MKKKQDSNDNSVEKDKNCFIIMPIADVDGYDKGHFKRVYEYIIKPAVIKSGYTPIRADDVSSTNYIVIDILRNLVDCELAICDLSSRNPNVLYELGIRQAFNMPTVLMKDEATSRIFDIQGLRDIEYNHNLRIDNVNNAIESVVTAIKETVNANPHDINSIIQLLSIKPANINNQVDLSDESNVILSAINNLGSRISNIESSVINSAPKVSGTAAGILAAREKLRAKAKVVINSKEYSIGQDLFKVDSDEYLGCITGFSNNNIIARNISGESIYIPPESLDSLTTDIPF